MTPALIITILVVYFSLLILISYWTSKGADSNTFFTGDRQSPWYLVAFGMIGTSLSGVTFISVPGGVINTGMTYFQVVLGYVLGYVVIAKVLMPLYYKMNLISIYEYLEDRFGKYSYKSGAFIFIVSRTIGSALRLYLATIVLQMFLFEGLGVPYWVTAIITVLLIWVYTFKGGVKTIVYTDAFQTIFLITSIIVCTVIICQDLDVSFVELYNKITLQNTGVDGKGFSMTKIFYFDDYKSTMFFPKSFLGGMFLAIAMTGLDQDLMQKNLTCKNIKEAQKNMYSFTFIMVCVNFLFLILGGALYVYVNQKGIMSELPLKADGFLKTDYVFPFLTFGFFGTIAGVFFLLGITASSYASADSALAALTTGFCIDFLNFKRKDEKTRQSQKLFVHIGFSLLFLIICLIVNEIQIDGLIDIVLKVAGYTYGPLLGLFFFGILTKRKLIDYLVPYICIIAPVLIFILDKYSIHWFNKYKFGSEIIIINGLLTYIGLFIISKPTKKTIVIIS